LNAGDRNFLVRLDHLPEEKPLRRSSGSTGTQTIERAFDILRLIAASSSTGVRLKDVAEQMGLPAPTAHRILKTLCAGGLTEKRPEGARYFIGSELALLGLSSSMRRFRELAAPTLRVLSDEVGDAVFLSVRSDLDTVCADRKIGTYPIQVLTFQIGSRRPLGISANSVAILSRMASDEAQKIIMQNMGRLISYKIPADVLIERVNEARKRGYVHIRQAIVKGTSALAHPVLDVTGRPVAAVSTIAIASRQPSHRIPRLVSLLADAAKEIGSMRLRAE
jgi:DNA-binding IclR family transcriptional regulator